MKLEYASRVVAKKGEARSGDAVFARVDDFAALFVIIDGMGHGDAAFLVAERALAALEDLPRGADAEEAIFAMNSALSGTRGAAATAFSVVEDDAQLAGIGNVTCRGIGFRCPFVPTPGVLGRRKQLPDSVPITMAPGQGLVLHSDGVAAGFGTQDSFADLPRSACDFLLDHHRHEDDDATVLVIAARTHIGRAP